jgi:glycosyltransferase involved in cell wall biosynthesis
MDLQSLTKTEQNSDRSQQLKVLLSAYACEPNRGSEPGVGWNMAVEIAKHHAVWVLTSNTHRDAIEAELKVRPIANLTFVYFDPLSWVYDWSQEGKRAHWDVHIHYYLWQIWAYFVGRSLHKTVSFNLSHHVTYVKYSSPSFLSFLPIPFVWGPVGGGESAPVEFRQGLSPRAQLYEVARDLARQIGELDPFVHLTARRSVLAWATTEQTADRLQQVGATQIQLLSQIGLNAEEIEFLASHATWESVPTRFISVGRLIHWKGFHLGLRAFAQAKLPDDAEYWIVGEGPEMRSLQALAQELGIAHQIKFWDKLSRSETLQRIASCLALIHPSLHDSGGLVCLEAMAAGCPVICLDLGGPGVQVTAETGFKIPADHPEQAVRDLAKAIALLASQPELRQRLGQAGQQHIHDSCNWQAKGTHIAKFYQTLLVSR